MDVQAADQFDPRSRRSGAIAQRHQDGTGDATLQARRVRFTDTSKFTNTIDQEYSTNRQTTREQRLQQRKWPKLRARIVPAAKTPFRAAEKTARHANAVLHLPSHDEREQLILKHLPLVRYIAKRIHGRLPHSVLLEDLIETGVLGLIEAIQHYDPNQHVDLGAYAKHRIRGAILDSLRALDWGSRQLRKKARDLDEARGIVQTRTGRSAEEEDLAREAGIRVEELRRLQEKLLRLDHSALHEQKMDEENGISIEQQPAKRDLDPYRLCLRSEVKELLGEAVSALPKRERQILEQYYYEGSTMKEISLALGVSEARISQLHATALERLRKYRTSLVVRIPCAAF